MTRARQILKWRSHTQFGWMYQGAEWKRRDRKRDVDVSMRVLALDEDGVAERQHASWIWSNFYRPRRIRG